MKLLNGHACLVGVDDPSLCALGLKQSASALAAWRRHIRPIDTHVSVRMMFYCTLRRSYPETTELTVDYGKGACAEGLCRGRRSFSVLHRSYLVASEYVRNYVSGSHRHVECTQGDVTSNTLWSVLAEVTSNSLWLVL